MKAPKFSGAQKAVIIKRGKTIINLCETEIIHRLGLWKSANAVECETLKWIDCFNNRRLLVPVGNIPPAEAERDFFETITGVNMVA